MKPKIHFFDKTTVFLLMGLAVLSVMMVLIGSDFKGLDLKFYYTGAEALKILSSLSLEQRQRYSFIECLDFIYISIYTSLLLWNLRKLGGRRLFCLGVIPGLCDIVENVGIMFWLQSPFEYSYLGSLRFLTMAKWVTGLSLAFLCLSLFVLHACNVKWQKQT